MLTCTITCHQRQPEPDIYPPHLPTSPPWMVLGENYFRHDLIFWLFYKLFLSLKRITTVLGFVLDLYPASIRANICRSDYALHLSSVGKIYGFSNLIPVVYSQCALPLLLSVLMSESASASTPSSLAWVYHQWRIRMRKENSSSEVSRVAFSSTTFFPLQDLSMQPTTQKPARKYLPWK